MIYDVTKWTIEDLKEVYFKEMLDLSPPYQRNFIWTIYDQQHLINSIQKQNPIPNFFLLQKKDKSFEMVDGQQRSRTILSFLKGQFKDLSGNLYSDKTHSKILKYDFPVTIITDTQGESIEKFYAMVNKTGIHVNKPEIRKADYYDSNILKLVEEINTSEQLTQLDIFTAGSMKRMNDVEFISELVVLLKEGHVDKKAHIDDYYKSDFTPEECDDLREKFKCVLDRIVSLNKVYKINDTRYKQKNDFYTLFDFVFRHLSIKVDTLKYFYKILVAISVDIKPTQEKCEVLREYARNCVTQSNSKAARSNRLTFFEDLLLNTGGTPNNTQKQLIKFYKLKTKDLINVDGYLELEIDALNKTNKYKFSS